MKYRSGFRMLTLVWSDGDSFVPVSHCLLSAAEDKDLLCEGDTCEGDTCDGRSRYLLCVPVMVEKAGESIPAKFVYVRNKSERKDWLVIVSRYGAFRRRDHPHLWETLGHRGFLQGMQILPKLCKRIPGYLL